MPKLDDVRKQQLKQVQDPGNARRNATGGASSGYTIPIPAAKEKLPLTAQRYATQGSTMAKNDETIVL